jgi:hypothetical protein
MNKLFEKFKALYRKNAGFKAFVITSALAIGYGSHLYTKHNDGPIEQAAEAVLRTQGIDIDLSPDD